MQLPLKKIEGKECFIKFFEQNGLNPFWNKIWNKIYAKEIFDKALNALQKFENDVNYTPNLFYLQCYSIMQEKLQK